MNFYETLYIVHPALEAGRLKDIIMGVEDSLKKMGGDPLATELWGKRKLAYFIDKQKYGTYVLVQYNGEGKCTGDFAVELEHNPNILAYLTTKIEKDKIIEQENDLETQIAGKTREAERSASPSNKDEEKVSITAESEKQKGDLTGVINDEKSSKDEVKQTDSETEKDDSHNIENVELPIEKDSNKPADVTAKSKEVDVNELKVENTTKETISESNQEKADDKPTAISEKEQS